jgi:predicted methyltransferase
MKLANLLPLGAVIGLIACQPAEQAAVEETPPVVEAAVVEVVTISPAKVIATAIAAIPGRSEEDAARDAGRKPAEVLAFLGLEPGMRVLDVMASGGWYSEVLAGAVGPDGVVLVQNPPALLAMRDGAYGKALVARFGDGRIANVTRIDADLTATGIEPGSVDLAITALNFHDLYNLMSPEVAAGSLEAIAANLKPGGVLGIIDHYGAPDGDNKALHRIDPQLVRGLIEASSLLLEAESGMLHNPDDDLGNMVFAPGTRGKTHRFLFRLRKPAA